MGKLDSSIIKIDCSCGNKREINRKKQKQIFNEEITIGKLSNYYEKFECKQCKSKYPKVFDKNNNVLFDPENLKKCKICKKCISLPRLSISENIDTCSPICEKKYPKIKYSKAEESILKLINYNAKIEKNLEIQKRNEKYKKLIDMKMTMINAYNSYKSKKISNLEYETTFKKFSWEIKSQVEDLGGSMIDDPRNYIKCERCNNFSLILWTPKYNRYFIGCSQYSKGCNWAKTIWVNDV
jgi:hypothetical protein